MPVAFELVSPEALLLSQDVDMVVVPGSAGDFGVLPGHSPLVSQVRPGVVHIFSDGAVSERVFVAGGFAEVTGERCTVLTEEAVHVGEIDTAAVERDLHELGEEADSAGNEADRVRVALRIQVAQAKLAAVNEPVYS